MSGQQFYRLWMQSERVSYLKLQCFHCFLITLFPFSESRPEPEFPC